MSNLTPCPIHASYVQCPNEECTEPVCQHRKPHYPIPYNLGSVSVSCRIGDLWTDEEYGCPGCVKVSNTILAELMLNCSLCQQPIEEEE